MLIPGAIASSLTIPNVQSANARDYGITVYNLAGAVNSRAVSLRVTGFATLLFTDNFIDPNNANVLPTSRRQSGSRTAGRMPAARFVSW